MMQNSMTPGLSATPDLSLIQLGLLLAGGLAVLLVALTCLAIATIPLFLAIIRILESLFEKVADNGSLAAKMVLLSFRSLQRNLLRTCLTYTALGVFTGILTLIYSLIAYLGSFTVEKDKNLKVIMTEKFQIPSQMPPRYIEDMKSILLKELPPESQPRNLKDDFMQWGFVGGSLSADNKTMENALFFFALEPHSLVSMMDGLTPDDMTAAEWENLKVAVEKMKEDKRNIILGKDRLKMTGKEVGDEVRLFGLNYKDIEFDYKIVGVFPEGRYNLSAAMRYDYLLAKLDDYKTKNNKAHPLAERCTNLIWIRLPDRQAFERLAAIVNDPARFSNPSTKMETASSGIGSFLDSMKSIFWGLKYLLMPTMAIIMALVVAITMSISIRERWTEMAMLKVLGFRPNHVFIMVVGEALLVGLLAGTIMTVSLSLLLIKGVNFPIAFFTRFYLPWTILVYGPLLGLGVGVFGSYFPAWSARGVKASEVFSQVA